MPSKFHNPHHVKLNKKHKANLSFVLFIMMRFVNNHYKYYIYVIRNRIIFSHSRIEKILTISQCKSLKERWTINLKIDNMDEDLANRSRLPKKRLFKSFHLEEEDQPNGNIF